ncbi:MAG: GTPase, partial [Bacteroidota bacterium]
SVVIVGKPNVGKSSLFNALLKENRAIVTEIPGTTRDSLEESIAIGGVLFRLNDTAGLRETVDPVEVEGVSRAKGLVKQADVLLLVVDATEGVKRVEALSFVNDLDIPKSAVIAYNKIDICQRNGFSGGQFKMKETTVNEVLISAKTGEGLDELRKTLLGYVASDGLVGGGIHVTNSRHQAALLNASDSLSTAEKAVESGTSREFIALDIKSASDSLAEIVGEIATDDMLNNIFQHFCIGK